MIRSGTFSTNQEESFITMTIISFGWECLGTNYALLHTFDTHVRGDIHDASVAHE